MDRTGITFDFRPRIQFDVDYKKFGLYVGYSYGLINYMMYYDGDAILESYARFFRFGITYKIK